MSGFSNGSTQRCRTGFHGCFGLETIKKMILKQNFSLTYPFVFPPSVFSCENHPHFSKSVPGKFLKCESIHREAAAFPADLSLDAGGVWQNWQKPGRIFTACQAGLKSCLISFQLSHPAPREPAERQSWKPQTHLYRSSNLWPVTFLFCRSHRGDCCCVQPITGLFQAGSSKVMVILLGSSGSLASGQPGRLEFCSACAALQAVCMAPALPKGSKLWTLTCWFSPTVFSEGEAATSPAGQVCRLSSSTISCSASIWSTNFFSGMWNFP